MIDTLNQLKEHLNQSILGQEELTRDLLIALVANGHILLEGPPGIAKTTAAKSLSKSMNARFQRIQFTPDLLPGDVTGSDVFQQDTGQFSFSPGPLMNEVVLADEINRAPAKVQSALLEAMGERQLTVGGKTYALPDLFFVIATQNPIEQEGTYPLPEAQLDRFLMKLIIDYPSKETELAVMRLVRQQDSGETEQSSQTNIVNPDDIMNLQNEALSLYMAESVEQYIVELVMATRFPSKYIDEVSDDQQLIEFGASPRATIALDRCARANALIAGRDFVTPDDVRQIAVQVLRHRIVPSFEAETNNFSSDDIIKLILAKVPVI
ncbi:AAA family ATPase [Marinomonas mediterranea]|jgi:MoxR-like ATPases|uniref:ATPase associated with various cellular activities AAA_3 n=1 Tax=Marinomonas mediterranea (strain ATCC 700492 / JCM 21426 / NBRC 103028 / MMB-1) TaxID=717774 RepID=F2JWN4_MARM1|nr:MoxR family ATPase [Marinomonas mediterranea]ADZ91798.1 ATPase associated with various cellular activities AAA_3 [Marinomonas mediterranea MMB-1]WCN09753.1 AAA domain-containing protein [Marinomonas mediterranea]WCN13835.1 AAA domain-containing protein [Marinomonas mediterranea]WCN17891.1 AAA domain-containing protein [Marinomonas mediterranea MMB-1]